MTTARQFYEQQANLSVIPPQKNWPTMYDLPSEDPQEPGLPDEFHDLQPQLLSATLRLTTVARDQMFTGSDLNLYYDPEHPTWYKRPDWFAVAGVPRLYNGQDLRLSYVTWDEEVVPFVIVELISPGTAMSDLGELKREPNGTPTKWQVYEQILKVPHYVVFDRYQDKLRVFKLIDGQYQEQIINDGKIWFEETAIGLGIWHGEFDGITRSWLRWYKSNGEWILTEAERQESRADAQQQRADIQQQRADRLAARLKELGIDPNEL